jgi:hypothetical protein
MDLPYGWRHPRLSKTVIGGDANHTAKTPADFFSRAYGVYCINMGRVTNPQANNLFAIIIFYTYIRIKNTCYDNQADFNR